MDLYDRNDPHKSGQNNFGTKRCHIQENCIAICRFLWCYTNNDQNDIKWQQYIKHTKLANVCKCYLRQFKIALEVHLYRSYWCLIIPVVRVEGMNAKGTVDPILSHHVPLCNGWIVVHLWVKSPRIGWLIAKNDQNSWFPWQEMTEMFIPSADGMILLPCPPMDWFLHISCFPLKQSLWGDTP